MGDWSAYGLIDCNFQISSRGHQKAHGFFFGIKQGQVFSVMNDSNSNEKNIVLIGYRCSGKTEVGKILARDLKREFVDTDRLIEEKAGCSIEDFVRDNGWDRFRDLERQVVEEASKDFGLVIATGGGVVLDGSNVENLKKNGDTIWLKADARILIERMISSSITQPRPSLTGKNPEEEVEEVLSYRTSMYKKAGDISVDTGELSIKEVVESIIKSLD